MDFQPIDIALFLVSFAACIYCIVLSRRLKALQDTKDGLGATIMAMTKSVSAISSATHETRAQTGELANRLGALIKEADASCQRISEHSRAAETLIARMNTEAQTAKSGLSASFSQLNQQARKNAQEVQQLLQKVEQEKRRMVQHAYETPSPRRHPASGAVDAEFLFEDDIMPVKRAG